MTGSETNVRIQGAEQVTHSPVSPVKRQFETTQRADEVHDPRSASQTRCGADIKNYKLHDQTFNFLMSAPQRV